MEFKITLENNEHVVWLGDYELYRAEYVRWYSIETDEAIIHRLMKYLSEIPAELQDIELITSLIQSKGIEHVRNLYYLMNVYNLIKPYDWDINKLTPLMFKRDYSPENYKYTVGVVYEALRNHRLYHIYTMMFGVTINSRIVNQYAEKISNMFDDLCKLSEDLISHNYYNDIATRPVKNDTLFDVYNRLLSYKNCEAVIYYLYNKQLYYQTANILCYGDILVDKYPDVGSNVVRFCVLLEGVVKYLIQACIRNMINYEHTDDLLRIEERECQVYNIGGLIGLYYTCCEAGNGSNSLLLYHPIDDIEEFLSKFINTRYLNYLKILSYFGITPSRTHLNYEAKGFKNGIINDFMNLDINNPKNIIKLICKYSLHTAFDYITYDVPDDLIPSPSGFMLIPWKVCIV